MQFYLNPVSICYEDNDYIYFLLNSSDQIKIQKATTNKIYIEKLYRSGDVLEKIELFFGTDTTVSLIKNKTITTNKYETLSMYSRTQGYHTTFNNNTSISSLPYKTLLILGAGALGTHVLWSSLSYGINKIIIVDYDVVDESNLNRQLYYSREDIGKSKIKTLAQKSLVKNENQIIHFESIKISEQKDLQKITNKYQDIDLIVKAIDTPSNILEIINKEAVVRKIPFISGGFNQNYLVIDHIYIPDKTTCLNCRNTSDIPMYGKKITNIGATTPEMPQLLAGYMIKYITDIMTNNVLNIKYNEYIAYDLNIQQIYKQEHKLENKVCSVCKMNNIINKPDEKSIFNVKSVTMVVIWYLCVLAISSILPPAFSIYISVALIVLISIISGIGKATLF